MLEKKPFRLYDENKTEKSDIISIRLNNDERAILESVKNLIEQEKDGTALKMLFLYGANNVLHDVSLNYFITRLFKNRANNTRLGITEFDTNVTLKKGV